ncbi:hypothetical protein DXG01_015263 [Tephrocybe rancida]|nr:hypothetical protein DXG01_015263 [Tephrocybe rancida]
MRSFLHTAIPPITQEYCDELATCEKRHLQAVRKCVALEKEIINRELDGLSGPTKFNVLVPTGSLMQMAYDAKAEEVFRKLPHFELTAAPVVSQTQSVF